MVAIQPMNYGGELANAYIVGNESEPCILIDFPNAKLLDAALRHHPFVAAIFLTHGHYDHIAGLNDLPEGFEAPIVFHPDDEEFFLDPRLNGSKNLFGQEFVLKRDGLRFYRCEDEDEILPDRRQYVDEKGEKHASGGTLVRVLHVPYHTKGSIALYLPEEGVLFSGDSLFRFSVGRSDLPGASPRQFEDSMAKIMALPGQTIVYPGHGGKTTIGEEARFNPFLIGIK